MTPRLQQAMRDHFPAFRFVTYNGERSPRIFHHRETRRHHEAGARIHGMHQAFDFAADRAKIPERFGGLTCVIGG